MILCKCGYKNSFNDTNICGYCGEDTSLKEEIEIDDTPAGLIRKVLPDCKVLIVSEYWYKVRLGRNLKESDLVLLHKYGLHIITGFSEYAKGDSLYLSTNYQVDAIARLHNLQ